MRKFVLAVLLAVIVLAPAPAWGQETLRLPLDSTDEQLAEAVKGLTKLESLDLYDTKVTDAGLVHLKGLTNLETLDLAFTKVTGAGLVHLKGLTNLETLWLTGTKVTDAGVASLKEALPNCAISH